MSDRSTLLKLALIVFGVVFCLIYLLAMFWPAGWAWHTGAPYANEYYMMIVGVYFTLGVFLILASRDLAANRSLILFTIVSSVVHAGIMAWQALQMPEHRGHLYGDVPALLLVAIVLFVLLPASGKSADTVTGTAS